MPLSPQQMAYAEAQVRAAQGMPQTEPEAVQRDQVRRVSFFEFFRQDNERLLRMHRDMRKAHIEKSLISALYYLGHQVLQRVGGRIQPKRLRGPHAVYAMNRLRPYSQAYIGMVMQSSPEVEYAVLIESERQRMKTLDAVTDFNNHQNNLYFTPEYHQRNAQFGQFGGNYTTEIFFDKDSRNGLEWYESYRTEAIPNETWARCLEMNCGSIGPLPENGRCQGCGSESLDLVPMAGGEVDVPDEQDWKPAGEIVAKFSPFWSHHFSYTKTPSESPWRYHEEDWVRETADAVFGKIGGTSGQASWQDHDEMMHPERIMRRAERERGQIGSETPEEEDCVLIQRFWREPEMLHYLALDAPVTIGEIEIPANQRLSEVFPNGMLIVDTPGSDRFLKVEHDSHRERFVDGIFGIAPGQNIGHGNDDAVEYQRQYNLIHSGEYKYLQRFFHPSIIVDSRLAQFGPLFNRPDGVIPVPRSAIPERGIGATWGVMQAPELSPRAPMLLERLDAGLQVTTDAQTSASDFPGVKNPTAAAARIGNSRQSAQHGIHLALYAGFLKEVRMRSLLLAQKHYGELRLINSTDAISGRRVAKVFQTADIRYSVMGWVKDGSYMPDLAEIKRANFMDATKLRIEISGTVLDTPEFLREIDATFQTNFAQERSRERNYQCEEELEAMMTAVEHVMPLAPFDPQGAAMLLYQMAPVELEEKGHEQKADWWRDLLGSPEGRTFPSVLREAIKLKIYAEASALMQERGFMAQVAAVGAGLLAPPNFAGLADGQPTPVVPQPGDDPNNPQSSSSDRNSSAGNSSEQPARARSK